MVECNLESVRVIDVETTHIDLDEAAIIQLAGGKFKSNNWDINSSYFGYSKKIPPEASAVHHITNDMIEGLPEFVENIDTAVEILGLNDDVQYFVAHNADFDKNILSEAFTSVGSNFTKKLKDQNNWICTWKLSKYILGIDYDKYQYNLSYLRYLFELDVPHNIGAHRADADVLVAGKLLEMLIEIGIASGKLISNLPMLEQLVEKSWAPLIVPTWPIGKYRGEKLENIPTDYFFWGITNLDLLDETSTKKDVDLIYSVTKILEKRGEL